MKKRILSLYARAPKRVWLFLIVIILCAFGFAEIADEVFDLEDGVSEAAPFDSWISSYVQRFRSPLLTQAMIDLTALGSLSVVLTLFIIMASVLLTFRDHFGLLYISIVLAGAGGWPLYLKSIFGRDRPMDIEPLVNATSYSFPSGHSFGAAAVYTALALYAGKYTSSLREEIFFYWLGGLLISVVGITRIYLGVHFPTDVLAGLFAGLSWTLMVTIGFELWTPFRSRGQSSP